MPTWGASYCLAQKEKASPSRRRRKKSIHMSKAVPPPLGLRRPSRQNIQYRLVVVQNPTRARCCGFGEKDKRPINPPPIVQLHIQKQDGSLEPVSETDNVSHFIVQCDLFSPNHEEDRNVVYNPASINPAYPNSSAAVMTFEEPTPVRNFLGTIVSNAHQLLDLEDRLGIFFIFPDLSVRTEGTFCLRFRFIDLSAGDPMTMSTQVLTETFSDTFNVYPAKHFPGMTGSTPLSLCFSRQGIKISVRKGPRLKRSSDDVFGDPQNDDDDDMDDRGSEEYQRHQHSRRSVTAISALVSSDRDDHSNPSHSQQSPHG
ncbi:vea protein [Lichtheimia corymbifera JMRC:FSU:9682]|uniref:Vea protein n=1 Tax=Lichtheimia corymbifera JMRC:FSU:9682 TaxID=1263082 RepID=A0A068RGW9_9FUNG|nr:vea protein [Lichtheimia corymbifera JMRC:FSU:9682]